MYTVMELFSLTRWMLYSPKQLAVLFRTNQKAHAWQHCIHVYLLGSSLSAKVIHDFISWSWTTRSTHSVTRSVHEERSLFALTVCAYPVALLLLLKGSMVCTASNGSIFMSSNLTYASTHLNSSRGPNIANKLSCKITSSSVKPFAAETRMGLCR